MANGWLSPPNCAFPAGLRVLIVDDDPTWLKILEKMLKKCSYEVTICCLAREALTLLRETKDGYDIVISDVNMPDMDGFKLLELVGLEMDLPVIMMSVDGETSRVMKGVQHGACDYLLKPIRMKELRNIWQHVFRKKRHDVRDFERIEGFQMITSAISNQLNKGPFLQIEESISTKKRKYFDKQDDGEFSDASSMKKARVVWTVDLHQKFVRAVNQIGLDKAGPKKIRDLMNVPQLTRENVASHLQKYRLYLSRLQKENNPESSFPEDLCARENIYPSIVSHCNQSMLEPERAPTRGVHDPKKTWNPTIEFNPPVRSVNPYIKTEELIPGSLENSFNQLQVDKLQPVSIIESGTPIKEDPEAPAFNLCCITDLEGGLSSFSTLEDLQGNGYDNTKNLPHGNYIEFPETFDPRMVMDFPNQFGYEYSSYDMVDYSVKDEGLSLYDNFV